MLERNAFLGERLFALVCVLSDLESGQRRTGHERNAATQNALFPCISVRLDTC